MSVKTFVVPLDGSELSERAVPVAEALADRVGGRLLLVSTQDHGPLDPRWYLDEVAARHQRGPVDVVDSQEERAADLIVETVLESDDRVVCMTSHGRGRLRWSVLGSVAEEVVGRLSRPVVLVGPHCPPDPFAGASQLLVATDGRAAPNLVDAACEWSALLDLDLHAAFVAHPLDVETSEHPEPLLDSIARHFEPAGPMGTTILRSGYTAGALADFANEQPVALIALQSHARAGLGRLTFGSVTMGVLGLAGCPVLVVRGTQ